MPKTPASCSKHAVAGLLMVLLAVPAWADAAKDANSGPITAFTAFGDQPAWRAVIDGGKLSLEGQGVPEGRTSVRRQADAKGALYSGRLGRQRVELDIRGRRCTQADGQRTEFTARLSVGGKVMRGCAVAGAQAHAPT